MDSTASRGWTTEAPALPRGTKGHKVKAQRTHALLGKGFSAPVPSSSLEGGPRGTDFAGGSREAPRGQHLMVHKGRAQTLTALLANLCCSNKCKSEKLGDTKAVPHSNGSLAQRRPVSPSRGVQTSCPWHFRPHPTSKQAPERRQNQGLGEVTPPLPLTRCVTLAKSPALSKPQRQEGAKREIGGGLGALESGFLNPNFLAAWPWAGCLTCLRPESLTCETGIVTELNSQVCRED